MPDVADTFENRNQSTSVKTMRLVWPFSLAFLTVLLLTTPLGAQEPITDLTNLGTNDSNLTQLSCQCQVDFIEEPILAASEGGRLVKVLAEFLFGNLGGKVADPIGRADERWVIARAALRL